MTYTSPKYKKYSRELRSNMTKTERHLWKFLRKQNLKNAIFRRQFNIGHYIVDFICFHSRLIVECDGGQHATQQEYDLRRDGYLKSQGFKVLRFWDHDVLQHTDAVLETIARYITPPPQPSFARKEGAIISTPLTTPSQI